MDRLVSAEKMRLFEEKVFSLGIDSFSVMEKAAMRIFDEVKKRISPSSKVLVICGRGNNGGDGLAVARMLEMDGKNVNVCLPFGEPSTADAKKNFEIVKKLGINIVPDAEFNKFDIIIDALL